MSRRTILDTSAIVTGASSGIGREIALELARQGARLVVTARRADRLATLAKEIVVAGGRVETVAGDVSDPAVRRQTIDVALSVYGGLDLLVNNAGIGAMGLFEEGQPETVRRVMEVNFFALVEMTRLALPLLKQGRRPMVVNVGSILGHRGVPHNSEYAASKFAVQGFSQSIRAEFHRLGINVLVVSPGTTQTEFFDRALTRNSSPAWPEHKPVPAAAVARATVRAIRRGDHEIVPYFWGKVLCLLDRLSPRLVNRVMTRYV